MQQVELPLKEALRGVESVFLSAGNDMNESPRY